MIFAVQSMEEQTRVNFVAWGDNYEGRLER